MCEPPHAQETEQTESEQQQCGRLGNRSQFSIKTRRAGPLVKNQGIDAERVWQSWVKSTRVKAAGRGRGKRRVVKVGAVNRITLEKSIGRVGINIKRHGAGRCSTSRIAMRARARPRTGKCNLSRSDPKVVIPPPGDVALTELRSRRGEEALPMMSYDNPVVTSTTQFPIAPRKVTAPTRGFMSPTPLSSMKNGTANGST